MKNFIFLFCILFSIPVFSQDKTDDEVAIKTVINQLFDGMRTVDSTKIIAIVYPNATLKTVYINKAGIPKVHTDKMDKFITSVGTPHEGVYDEQILSYDIKIDGNLATAWTEYSFYVDSILLHCGVNAFELFKAENGWKILGITDTRRKDNCQEKPTIAINTLMNNWHKAAATADEDVFFGSMTEDCIYIGTDASERWLRDELKAWSAEFFKKDKAWDFKPIERQVFFSDNGKTAWFNETLNTWMGVCRSSGVLAMTKDGWKIKQYHLSMTIPNDAVKEYLEMVKKYD
jgi:hypothetical protein